MPALADGICCVPQQVLSCSAFLPSGLNSLWMQMFVPFCMCAPVNPCSVAGARGVVRWVLFYCATLAHAVCPAHLCSPAGVACWWGPLRLRLADTVRHALLDVKKEHPPTSLAIQQLGAVLLSNASSSRTTFRRLASLYKNALWVGPTREAAAVRLARILASLLRVYSARLCFCGKSCLLGPASLACPFLRHGEPAPICAPSGSVCRSSSGPRA